MNYIDNLNWRYATKRMNGSAVASIKVERILEAIRLAPTSFGLQPFKVFVIENQLLKERIYNEACQQPQIKESSHLLIFTANKKVTAKQIDDYMQLIASTRAMPLESLNDFKTMFNDIVAGNEQRNFNWTARQAYIAFGVGIMAAAEEQVDATPMEGFDADSLDRILDLKDKNLGSVTILALGYRDEIADYLANAPKVRKNKVDLVVEIK